MATPTADELRKAIAAGKQAGAAAGPGGIDPSTCPYPSEDPRSRLWSRWAVDAWLTSLGWPEAEDPGPA